MGVAAVVRVGAEVSRYWMSGYAASDDMARAAMVQHLLASLPDTKPQLVVWSTNIEALKHVPSARANGGMRSGKNKKLPFAAYDLFDPVEAALRDGRWFLQTFGRGEEPGDFDAAQRLAERALWVAKDRAIEFAVYRADYPDWHMLETGSTDNPASERNERA
ncbi:MAG: hypothetical protein EWV70_09490 [Microcystis flos-aquae Mf_QC_C_20070823_S20]|nr:MAG: hypothetical protein EWV70_09490 [Microcystis flos-aquae Mf_QC_C_20070823_S20]